MTHQLITTDPVARVTEPVGGYRPQRQVAEGQIITAPAGHAYVPIESRPVYDQQTQRLEQQTTLEKYGWQIVDLTPEEIEARNAPPARVTRRQLFLSLLSLPTPLTRAEIRQILSGNELALVELDEAMYFERHHPLVLHVAPQVFPTDTEAQVDELFRQAADL